jgi:hypothetical protein
MVAREDDPSVEGDEVLFRRVARQDDTAMTIFDEGLGTRLIRSGAFRFDPDGCSVYRRATLHACGLSAQSVVKLPQNIILSVLVDAVRAAGFGVTADPNPHEDDHPRSAAHSLILNTAPIRNKALVRACRQLAASATVELG